MASFPRTRVRGGHVIILLFLFAFVLALLLNQAKNVSNDVGD